MIPLVLTLALAVLLTSPAQSAPTDVVARVNGVEITEADIEQAQAEVGAQLAQVPEESRRPILVNFLIETHLMAEAAEKANLATSQAFKEKLDYYRRQALREVYIENSIRDEISEAVAKAIYDDQIKSMKPKEEVKARHILVSSEDEAKEVIARLKKGAEFEKIAKEKSLDKASDGGELGWFPRGRMVKSFEDAVFTLKKGEFSQPVKSQFGWHVIQLQDRRNQELPKFDEVKDRIMASLMQQKAQEVVGKLRKNANVEVLDPGVKKAMDEAEKRQADQMKQMQQMKPRQEQQGDQPKPQPLPTPAQ